jgi:prefoldin subunit 5
MFTGKYGGRMIHEERINQLEVQANQLEVQAAAILGSLGELIAGGAADAVREGVADQFNAIQVQIQAIQAQIQAIQVQIDPPGL